jgi:hypothetical protein
MILPLEIRVLKNSDCAGTSSCIEICSSFSIFFCIESYTIFSCATKEDCLDDPSISINHYSVLASFMCDISISIILISFSAFLLVYLLNLACTDSTIIVQIECKLYILYLSLSIRQISLL